MILLPTYSFQTLLLGPSDAQEQVAVAPDSTAQLTISGCQQLEILTKTFNSMASIQNVTLRDMEKVILHSRLYESRVGNGDSMTINNFDVENVSYNLDTVASNRDIHLRRELAKLNSNSCLWVLG